MKLDRTPLSHKKIARTRIPGRLLLEKLIKDRLPEEVRRAIVADPPCDLDELARRADRVMNESTLGKAFERSFKNEHVLSREKLLQEQVDNLSATVNKLLEATNIDKASTAL